MLPEGMHLLRAGPHEGARQPCFPDRPQPTQAMPLPSCASKHAAPIVSDATHRTPVSGHPWGLPPWQDFAHSGIIFEDVPGPAACLSQFHEKKRLSSFLITQPSLRSQATLSRETKEGKRQQEGTEQRGHQGLDQVLSTSLPKSFPRGSSGMGSCSETPEQEIWRGQCQARDLRPLPDPQHSDRDTCVHRQRLPRVPSPLVTSSC